MHEILVIETATNPEAGTVELDYWANDICMHPSGEYLYVTFGNSMEFSVVDLTENRVIELLPAGSEQPHDICPHPSGDAFYIVNGNSDQVSVLR